MKDMIKYTAVSGRLRSALGMLAVVIAVLMQAPVAFAQSEIITVKGNVKDASGQPMVGATVFVVNGQAGTTTDVNGNYTIKVAANGTLEYQFLGYASQQIKVNNRTNINVKLEQDNIAIEEVVAVGYATMAKTDLTGSITNVKMSDVKDAPVMSIDQALQGRIAGADIMSTTGEPGAATSIRIRGTRSITASNEPLIVVDDVIDAVSDLSDINPADVQSISVLKDASSTAIYGARGSNGVIIVTTNKGREGKPSITFKADVGFSQLPRGLDIMNATEFAQYRNDVYYFLNNYGEKPEEDYRYIDPAAMGKGTDWVKAITRTGMYQNYNLSVSGGDKKSKYFASFGYHNNDGIVINSGVQRYTGRLNVDRQLFKWLKLGANTSYEYRDNNNNKTAIGGTGWYNAAIYLNPMLDKRAVINDLWGTGFDGGQPFDSPYIRGNIVTNTTTRKMLNISPYVEIKPWRYLTIKSRFSYYSFQRHSYQFSPKSLPTYQASQRGGTAYRAETDETKLTNENTISFKKMFNKIHYVEAMVGFTAETFKQHNLTANGTGYLDDNVKWNNMNAIPDKRNLTVTTSLNERTRMSGIMRLYYNCKRRYYFTFTARYDGSSTFAKNNKWGFFPSGAFKWMISKERFMVNADWLDELALRLSAGLSGNDAISYYRSLAALGNTTGGFLFGSDQPVAFYPSRLASDNLTWEKTAMYNAAVDFAILNRRLEFTLEAYYARTTDLLLSVQLASHTGFTSRYANLGKTENKGVEFSITSRNIVKPKFSWTTTFTISHNKQKVLDIGTDEYVAAYSSPTNNSYMMYGYVKGYPLNALWGFKHAGVWHNDDEIARNNHTKAYVSTSASTYRQGYSRYVDVNHDGVLNSDDLVYLGSADPIVHGGLQNTFNIGKLKIGIYFNYSVGGKIYNLTELWMGNGSPSTNQYRYMLNAWHPVRNPNSNIPRAYSDDQIASDRMLHDASFIRLKNVSIGYTFDLRKYTKVIRDITVSASGENLYLWKNYNGFDPDVSTNSSGSTIRRMDNGAYPKPRTIIFSVQIRY
ncbi:MAG: TonB-dependent receptor [Alistipes sp.]|nr:TonB-dependent receptor [Alistipes sp.]